MIVSVSRRTDIPARYADWFFNRLDAGYVVASNPMNPKQIRHVSLSHDDVEGFVFWTKNPEPMMERLHLLSGFPHYFLFTLNGYHKDLEPGIPQLEKRISVFRNLSERCGKHRVIWRYDPILINPSNTEETHYARFESLCSTLHSHTEKCIVSFLDHYRTIRKAMKALQVEDVHETVKTRMMHRFAHIARGHGVQLETCAESMDFSHFGVKKSRCIDQERLETQGAYHLKVGKDRYQRKECGCAASVDIGMYNTCTNGCVYCYANHGVKRVQSNVAAHDSNSLMLAGEAPQGDPQFHR